MEKDSSPEQKREHLRQTELKNNPTGTLHDALNRGSNGNLTDFSGGMGWKRNRNINCFVNCRLYWV